MTNPMDPVLSNHTSQERQPAAVPELPNDQPHQSLKQSHTEEHTEQIEATSGEDHRRKNRQTSEQEGVPKSRCSTYAFYVRNISSTRKTSTMSWHAASWATMKKYNISTNPIQVIKNLYNKATSAVLFNDSIGVWF